MNRVRGEVARFILVGAAASGTHFAIGLALNLMAHVIAWQANIVAFLGALGVSYLGNSIFTFGVEARRAGAFARFFIMSAAAFALNQGLVWALTGPGHWPYWASLMVVLVVVPPLTFLISKYWALAERPG